MLVIAKDHQGKIQAVQAIFLDEKTAAKADVKVQKQTWGILSRGASVDIGNTHAKASPLYLAEGPETGLSIYAALPHAFVKVTLSTSNFKNIDSKTVCQHVVLCLDNDGNNPQTQKLIQFVAERLLTEGREVWVAKPEEIGKDYNDLLKEQGIEAIKNNIEKAVTYANYCDQKTPTVTLKSAVLSKLHKTPSELLFDPSAAQQFIRGEKEAIKLTASDEEKFAPATEKIGRVLAERASEFIIVAGSVSKHDIDKYLSAAGEEVGRTGRQPSFSQQKIQQPAAYEKVKDKDLEL